MSAPPHRVCTDCREAKPLDQFSKGNAAYGRKSYCKSCQTTRQRVYRAKNAASPRVAPVEKRCPKCKQVLPIESFWLASSEKDGHQRYCKACKRVQNKSWHVSRLAIMSQGRRARYLRKWAIEREQAKAWRRRNPLAYLSHMRTYQARKRGATAEAVSYAAIWERDGGICYLCSCPVDRTDVHFDHVIPLSKGGPHTADNIRVTHAWCNLRKSAKLLTEITP